MTDKLRNEVHTLMKRAAADNYPTYIEYKTKGRMIEIEVAGTLQDNNTYDLRIIQEYGPLSKIESYTYFID